MLEHFRRAELRRFRLSLALLMIAGGIAIAIAETVLGMVGFVVLVLLVGIGTLSHYQPDAIEHRAWRAWDRSSRRRSSW